MTRKLVLPIFLLLLANVSLVFAQEKDVNSAKPVSEIELQITARNAEGAVVDTASAHLTLEQGGALQTSLEQEEAVHAGAWDSTPFKLDVLWVLVAAVLVFFMQAGFKCFEVGMVREKSITSVGMKNVVDWIAGSLIFFLIGFALMFGKSKTGFFGTNLFFLDGLDSSDGNPMGWVFFMFQLAFAGTALTIVSGAMSERTGFVSYFVGSLVVAVVIYPVFGHWVWGNAFFGDNEPWLAKLGFMDFAGSTVVHSVGAWVALVGVWTVGPRLGRYNNKGEINTFKSYNFAYAVLGVFILWFGWWGFNGGSTLSFNSDVGIIILNTNLAGAGAGFSAFFHSMLFQNKEDMNEKLLGGILGGLVAITACCNVVSPVSALIIGLMAGIIHNLGFNLIAKRLKLDDPVGAIPVHGICGVFGTLCVAFFGKAELLAHPRLTQLGVQFVGIGACFVWTTSTAFVMYKVLKATVGLRVSPQEEQEGVQINGGQEILVVKGEEEEIDDELLQQLMAEESNGEGNGGN